MIRSSLTFVTTFAIALHALLGCCAHHHHSADGEGVIHSHAFGSAVVAGHHCSGQHADDKHGDESDHEPCDEIDCQFVTSPRGDDMTLSHSSDLVISVASAVILEIAPSGVLSVRSRTDHPPNLHASPQSLRAQTQVWLI